MNIFACPLCQSTRFAVLPQYRHVGLRKYGCSLVRCNDCGHCFTQASEVPDLGELYANEQYELVDTRRSMFGRLISLDVKSVLRQLERVKPQVMGASVLDFGCGKGVFLHWAAERGWRVLGVETASKRAEFARTIYGLEVISEEYSGGAIAGGPFDVITLFHVLEHLSNPHALVTSLVDSNLKANGMLVLEVPRFDSLQSVLAGNAWVHLDAPRHLSHFSTEAMARLMDDLGFKVQASSQFSFHNGLLGMVQGILSRLGYKKMLIEELKLRRTALLVLLVLAVAPLALALELVAILIGRGGIIRVYCSRAPVSVREVCPSGS